MAMPLIARVLTVSLAGLAALVGPLRAMNLVADFVCSYGCRQTDANPRLEIEGTVARCWNEIGGLYVGEFRLPDTVACFHKTGRIFGGGEGIDWSDGVQWRRKKSPP
jgi:hypothetical protein